MIKTNPQPIQSRVGLSHVSSLVARLIKLYELEGETAEIEDRNAAAHFEAEFGTETPISHPVPAILPVPSTQGTFGWFESV